MSLQITSDLRAQALENITAAYQEYIESARRPLFTEEERVSIENAITSAYTRAIHILAFPQLHPQDGFQAVEIREFALDSDAARFAFASLL